MTPPTLTDRVDLNQSTGEFAIQYFADGVPCAAVLLDSNVAKQYAGYYLLQEDLADARAWLVEALSLSPRRDPNESGRDRHFLHDGREPSNVQKALWFSAVVLYGKCFAAAEGRRVKLERGLFLPNARTRHDHYIGLRNTVVTHAGRTHYETAELQLVLDPTKRGYWLRVATKRIHFSDDQKDPVSLLTLIDLCQSFVQSKLQTLDARIKKTEIDVQPIEYWHRRVRHSGAGSKVPASRTSRSDSE